MYILQSVKQNCHFNFIYKIKNKKEILLLVKIKPLYIKKN